MSVELRNISKHFGGFQAVADVSLHVSSGELLALLGPSGSGKTTLLRIIGGLELPDPGAGQILLHDRDVTAVPAGVRQIGFVFQHYALFRHLTAFENVAFGLRVRRGADRPSDTAIRRKVLDLLKLVQLEALAERYPNQLSGGQRQRIALARALALGPKVLLLDEPFGALDAKVRKDLRRWIRKLHHEINVTSIFVTHDQDEALEVASRVVVMNEGRVEQVGTPNEVYDTPQNSFVYNFLGRVIALQARVLDGSVVLGASAEQHADCAHVERAAATVFARPQDIKLTAVPNGSLSVEALIRDVNLAGPLIYLELQRVDDGTVIEIEVPTGSHSFEPRVGKSVHLNLKRYQVFVEDRALQARP